MADVPAMDYFPPYAKQSKQAADDSTAAAAASVDDEATATATAASCVTAASASAAAACSYKRPSQKRSAQAHLTSEVPNPDFYTATTRRWTEPEHQSYLSCMEASFVQWMYARKRCYEDICGGSSSSPAAVAKVAGVGSTAVAAAGLVPTAASQQPCSGVSGAVLSTAVGSTMAGAAGAPCIESRTCISLQRKDDAGSIWIGKGKGEASPGDKRKGPFLEERLTWRLEQQHREEEVCQPVVASTGMNLSLSLGRSDSQTQSRGHVRPREATFPATESAMRVELRMSERQFYGAAATGYKSCPITSGLPRPEGDCGSALPAPSGKAGGVVPSGDGASHWNLDSGFVEAKGGGGGSSVPGRWPGAGQCDRMSLWTLNRGQSLECTEQQTFRIDQTAMRPSEESEGRATENVPAEELEEEEEGEQQQEEEAGAYMADEDLGENVEEEEEEVKALERNCLRGDTAEAWLRRGEKEGWLHSSPAAARKVIPWKEVHEGGRLQRRGESEGEAGGELAVAEMEEVAESVVAESDDRNGDGGPRGQKRARRMEQAVALPRVANSAELVSVASRPGWFTTQRQKSAKEEMMELEEELERRWEEQKQEGSADGWAAARVGRADGGTPGEHGSVRPDGSNGAFDPEAGASPSSNPSAAIVEEAAATAVPIQENGYNVHEPGVGNRDDDGGGEDVGSSDDGGDGDGHGSGHRDETGNVHGVSSVHGGHQQHIHDGGVHGAGDDGDGDGSGTANCGSPQADPGTTIHRHAHYHQHHHHYHFHISFNRGATAPTTATGQQTLAAPPVQGAATAAGAVSVEEQEERREAAAVVAAATARVRAQRQRRKRGNDEDQEVPTS